MNNPVFVRARFPRTAHDDQLQAQLIARDPLGFLEEDDWWEVYFNESEWDAVASALQTSWQSISPPVIPDVQHFDQENWNAQWEQSIRPIAVSDRIVITPSWHEVKDSEGLVLVIDPKMSFGTGYHQTTRLMLRLMEDDVRAGDVLLDVGTGTGVLAIAGVLLGAARADGVDTDEWSYENAMENAQRNRVSDRVRFAHGSLEHASGPYDAILSNITKLDNIAMLAAFGDLLRPGGRLLLSGFYRDDVADIRTALDELHFPVTREMHEDEWAALCAVKEK
ncbi:MAG: 50S ribosomal protein L11 methyltransferase [Bacteroidota bacterium]|nr:50S ribosomal protein L11 methyltransferase [Bacteroidota bacterium]